MTRFSAISGSRPAALPQPGHPLRHQALTGPFDLIGDLHGCLDELFELLARLGYQVADAGNRPVITPPPGRTLVFLGDLASRGPHPAESLLLILDLVAQKKALAVAGNQDRRLLALLRQPERLASAGPLERRLMEALEAADEQHHGFLQSLTGFLATLPGHLVLDRGHLVAAHAGLAHAHHGVTTPESFQLATHGLHSEALDEFGHPFRHDWAADYAGPALVAYGHTPVVTPRWTRSAINLDTGCVYGGHLSALRYPERETLSVPARALYSVSRRRFPPNPGLPQPPEPTA